MDDVTNPRHKGDRRKEPSYHPEDGASGREGGDDSLAQASPTDPRGDEKVIVNTQRADKIVNTPSQQQKQRNN